MAITDFSLFDPSLSHELLVNVDAAEGDKLVAYKDTLGNWTCGRGHLMPPAAPGQSWEGFTVIQSTSDKWFNVDLLRAASYASKLPEWPKCDTQARKDGLIEICFNMGSNKWQHFVNTRAAIEKQDWQGVYDGLKDSLWATQVGWGYFEDGKPKRAQRIANQFLTGDYNVASDNVSS